MNSNSNARDSFVNLHSHSEYSNLRLKDSTNKFERMIDRVANDLGQQGFALTDHACLSGHMSLLKTVETMKSKGKIPQDFKVALGDEIYLLDEEEMKSKLENKEYVNFYHFILVALNDEGHRQLRELSTRAWGKMFNYKGIDRVPTFMSDIEEIIGENRGNIVASSACLGGYVQKHILKEEYEKANEFIHWCQEVFGEENFYLELQPHKSKYDEYGNEVAHEQQIVNEWVLDSGYKYIITTDAHYLKEEDFNLHSAYLKSDEDDDTYSSGGREVKSFYETTYFMGSEEIRRLLHYLTDEEFESAINNANSILNRVEGYELERHQEVMKIPLPSRDTWYWDADLVDIIEEMNLENLLYLIDDDNEYNNYLASLWMRGFKVRNIPQDEVRDVLIRLDEEMMNLVGISEAKDTTMSAYFILMSRFIDIIWEEGESLIGVSRGSASGWVLNFLLGITQINPLKQPAEMPLWRFLSSERPDFADIDIDISSHKRDIVFSKISDYAESVGGSVVRVGTFKTESPKSAIQTSCRGLGIPSDIGLFISSLIPVVRGKTRSLHDTYYGNREEGLEPVAEFVNQIDKYEGLLETAMGIEDIVSGRSSHACGIVQSLDMLDSTATMKTPNGESITQYDLGNCESSGLIKYDILCTKTMAMIQLCLELLVEYEHVAWQGSLRATYDKYLHPNNLDPNNPKYFEVLNSGGLLSAFQFDSIAGEKALRAIKPQSLLELANANSLMRLMAEDGEQPIDMYVRYKNNPSEWEQDMIDFGLNEKERAILHRLLDLDYGVCSSQEGMMLMTMDKEVANFSVVDSNKLRKGVAKKLGSLYDQAHDLFYEKGLALGNRRVFLDYIWNVQIAMQRG